MVRVSIFSRISKALKRVPSGTSAVFSFTMPQLTKNAGAITTISRTAGRQILTWGNTLKGAVIAGGGVIAYKWFGSGIPAFFADTFGVTEEQGSWIAIICFAMIFVALLTYVFRRVRYSESKPFGMQKKRYRGRRR